MKGDGLGLVLALLSGFVSGTAYGVDAPPPPSGVWAWWGGEGNNIDSTLSVTVNLPAASSPTLSFWTYYATETYFDFGFVQISTDGGITITSLPIAGTTTERGVDAKPEIVAQLPGFNGDSIDWLEKSFDLTAWAGQEVVLQFRYMTDSARYLNGFFIDDISVISEEGVIFSDNVETPNSAWVATGWDRVELTVPEPTSLALFGLGLAGLGAIRRKKLAA